MVDSKSMNPVEHINFQRYLRPIPAYGHYKLERANLNKHSDPRYLVAPYPITNYQFQHR